MATVADILNSKSKSGGNVDLVSVPTSATVLEATQVMNASHVGSVMVVEGGAMAGILTERDLLRADAALPGDLGEGGVLVGELLGVGEAAERAPRQEGQAELLAHVDLGPGAAEGR